MSKTSFIKLFASASVAMLLGSPALAEKAAETTLRHGGETFVYTVSDQSEQRVIAGKRYPGGSDFRLVVRNGKVAGTVDGQQVSFKVADSAGAAAKAPVKVSLR